MSFEVVDTVKTPQINVADFPDGFGPFYDEFSKSFLGIKKNGFCFSKFNSFKCFNHKIISLASFSIS